MNAKIIERNTHAETLRLAVREINDRRARYGFSPDRRYILFVPDKYTLLAEKLLYGESGGAFDAEVLTIDRLRYKLEEYAGGSGAEKPLSRLGAVLWVRRILSENADSLVCFRRSAHFAGFGETMYDNLCQLAASGLAPDDLPDDVAGLTGKKLHDVKKIYAAFMQNMRGKYVDSAGGMLLLDKMLGACGAYFAGADVFFACYDAFMPLQNRIVQKICALCGEGHAYVYTAAGRLEIEGKRIEEYAAPSRADELKAAAVRIRALRERGVPYDDMGVIVPAADTARLKRIFTEYGIPYFADEKYALSSHPLARYLSCLFAAAQTGTNANYIRLSKSPYCGVSAADADVFENYVLGTALPEWGMTRAFSFEPGDPVLAGALPVAEAVRAKLAALVRGVHKENVHNGADLGRAIVQAMPPNEAEITAQFNALFPGVRGEIAAQAAVLEEVFALPVPFALLTEALEESFSLKEVGVIPNRAHTVEVGDVSAFRASGKKYLFAVGMQEGEAPKVLHDDGLLSDADLAQVAAHGDKKAVIEPSVEARNARAAAELNAVLSGSENLFLSYCTAQPPSPVLARIHELRAVRASSPESERLRLSERDEAARKLLLALCPTPAAALELYLIGKADCDAGGDGLGFENELAAALSGRVPALSGRCERVACAASLYAARRLSVSRVQEYFACPLRCFLRYGLKLKARPDGQVSPLDLGTFLHRVIELFVAGGAYDEPQSTVPAIVAFVRENEPQLLRGADERFMAELTGEAVTLAGVVAAQLRKGDFAAAYTEAAFGKEGAPLRGRTFTLPSGQTTAEGVIDRLDVADNGGAGLARVIDYKTGHAEFSYADIYYGRKIQLPVYLKVAQENGYTPAGMFYFPLSAGFSDDSKSHRLRGIFDERYAAEMDGGLRTPLYASDVVCATAAKQSAPDKTVLRKTGSAAVRGETLAAVCDYAEAVFAAGAAEMQSGYCAAAPLGGGNECAYCEVKDVCTALGGKTRERTKRHIKCEWIETVQAAQKETDK